MVNYSIRIPVALLLTVFLSNGCKKDDEAGPPGPAVPSGPAIAPNSIVSFDLDGGWWRDTSMANSACLDGSVLTLECHPSMTTMLTFEIPNYVGPDTYLLGPQGSARYYDQLNTPAGSYFTQGTDSSGYLIVNSFSATGGLSGAFAGELFRGSTIQLENGILDGVRNSCILPDSFLVYSVGVLPAVTPFGEWTCTEDVTDHYSTWRTSDLIIINHFDQGNIPTIGPMNTFQLVLPRDVQVGLYDDSALSALSALEALGLTFSTPSETYYRNPDPTNSMEILEHDPLQRHIKGSLVVRMSFGLRAQVHFDVLY